MFKDVLTYAGAAGSLMRAWWVRKPGLMKSTKTIESFDDLMIPFPAPLTEIEAIVLDKDNTLTAARDDAVHEPYKVWVLVSASPTNLK